MPFQIILWVGLAGAAAAWVLHRAGAWDWPDGLQVEPNGGDGWTPDELFKLVQATVLTLGFLGITATAVVTYRRQRNAERELDLEERRERDQSRYERYAKGSEMLGHDDPAIRMAGLNVIAQLGREPAPDQAQWQQASANLICAYLRSNSPSRPAATATGPEETATRHQGDENTPAGSHGPAFDRYRVVTEEACRLISGLLDPAQPPPWWNQDRRTLIDLDLHSTHLPNLDLSQRHVGTAQLGGAQFAAAARFDGAQLAGLADFRGAQFAGHAGFRGAHFLVEAMFVGAQFAERASYDEAHFGGLAWFGEANFGGGASFRGAQFAERAWFEGAHFLVEAMFRGAQFAGHAGFRGAQFAERASFEGAQFVGRPDHLDPRLLVGAIGVGKLVRAWDHGAPESGGQDGPAPDPAP